MENLEFRSFDWLQLQGLLQPSYHFLYSFPLSHRSWRKGGIWERTGRKGILKTIIVFLFISFFNLSPIPFIHPPNKQTVRGGPVAVYVGSVNFTKLNEKFENNFHTLFRHLFYTIHNSSIITIVTSVFLWMIFHFDLRKDTVRLLSELQSKKPMNNT